MSASTSWSPEALAVPIAASRRPVAMEQDLVNAVGLNHSIETALADLVDNSIDAHAREIRIRFLLGDNQRPIGLQVIDDGDGMSRVLLDKAVTYSAKREYGNADLGHFGVGLKAASFSQAAAVIVVTKAVGHPVEGCVMERSDTRAAPTVGDMSNEQCTSRFELACQAIGSSKGTLVEWQLPRHFPSSGTVDDNAEWIEHTIRKVRFHLGLVFHKLIEGRIGAKIGIDTIRVRSGHVGPIRNVDAIDPFGYLQSGDPDFPQVMAVRIGTHDPVEMTAHIWTPKAQTPEFKLDGLPREQSQGFYVYRRRRLLQIGGWCGIRNPRPEWSLARISLHLNESAKDFITINPEKSGVKIAADLRRAISESKSATETSLDQYLQIAATVDRRSRARKVSPVLAVEPGKGLPASVHSAFERSLTFRQGCKPVDIRWIKLPSHMVFAINFELRILELNSLCRDIITGQGNSTGPDDAPVFKALVHLLVEKFFAGQHLGPKDFKEIEAWNAILFAAANAQANKQ